MTRVVSWRGIALLVVTGAVGLALAVHGWSARSGTLPGQIAGQGKAAPGGAASSAPATPGTAPPASHQIGPTVSPSPTPSATPSSTISVGPSLASQSYAQYSFEVWPGPPSPAAKAAMTGLTIKVTRTAQGIQVVAGVVGQTPNPAQLYPGGTKVYVVEAAMGDDSNNADYNLGDDGVIVTNAAGRILR
ncbi:MAG TPA: hypothetical protein VFI65_17575 [Streptosporangiaceae bacterium]|nr:hypothetical protein [Streptosporangiaceae bacterium]